MTTTPGNPCRWLLATYFATCTMCATFLLKTQDHALRPRNSLRGHDIEHAVQPGLVTCNRNTGCYNNAISPHAAMIERNCPARIGKLFLSVGPELGPLVRKEGRACTSRSPYWTGLGRLTGSGLLPWRIYGPYVHSHPRRWPEKHERSQQIRKNKKILIQLECLFSLTKNHSVTCKTFPPGLSSNGSCCW